MDVVAVTEPKPKFIMEDVRPPVKLVEMKPSHPRPVDDDWFVQLNVAAKVPGILLFHVAATVRQNNTVSVCALQFYYISHLVQCMFKWNCLLTEKALCVFYISGCGGTYPYAS